MRNSYEILGVQENATEAEIKAAFRKEAMQCHPDRHPGDKKAEERFKEINSAYQTIGDAKSRQEYDTMRKFSGGNRGPQGFNPGGFSQHDFNFNFNGEGMGGLDDIINQFFNQAAGFRGGGFAQQHQRRNRDINIAIEVTLDTLLTNKDIPIQFDHNGRRISLQAKIPAGVEHGTRMRFPGHGDNSIQGIPPGDLYAVINIKKHNIFERDHQNLIAELKVDAFDAIIGVKLPFRCLDNSYINVVVPPGTQHDTILTVSGKGLPLQQDGKFGDLLMKVSIKIPTNLTNSQINNLKKIMQNN